MGMSASRAVKFTAIALAIALTLLVGVSEVAERSYWVGLWYGTYIPLPRLALVSLPSKLWGQGKRYKEARAAVERRLISPGTAKWCGWVDADFGPSKENYQTVWGWVDATNAMGGVIRTRWRVEFVEGSNAEIRRLEIQ